jgi:hypothetical protein
MIGKKVAIPRQDSPGNFVMNTLVLTSMNLKLNFEIDTKEILNQEINPTLDDKFTNSIQVAEVTSGPPKLVLVDSSVK